MSASPESQKEERNPSWRSRCALDGVAFSTTDIANGLGAFTATYLQVNRHWDLAQVGAAVSAAGIAAVIIQTPAGVIIDIVRRKQRIVGTCALLVAGAALGIVACKSFTATVAFEAVIGAATTFVGAIVAAISLGLVGHTQLDYRIGRNQTLNHAGTVLTAVLAGVLGFAFNQAWVFYLIAIMNILAAVLVLFINGEEIDFQLSRGGGGNEGGGTFAQEWKEKMLGFREAFRDRRTLLLGFSLFLFYLGNAGILPLVGQEIGQGHSKQSTLYMGAAIVVAQLTMIPVSWMTGKWVRPLGRKKVFLIGFTCVPLRAAACMVSNNPFYLVAVQALDGISAGIFYVLSVLMISDITKGSGRFNAMQGFAATTWSLGAAFSPLLAGIVAKYFHFNIAFLFLAGLGVLAALFFGFFMPETGKQESSHSVA